MSIRNVPAILAAAMFVAVSFPANAQQSREVIEEFVKQNQAQLWIQHDYTSGIKRKIAPAFTAASAAMSVVRSRCSTKCSISGYSDTVIGWLSIVIGRTELLPPHCAGPACDGGPAYGGLRSQPSWTQEATIATPP